MSAELFAKWHPRILEEVSKLMVIARYLEAGGIVETLLKIDEALKSLHFKVSVLSVIKTGKTTFLNAILGAEFLPATTLVETAKSVRILHDPSEKDGVLFIGDKEAARGHEDICNRIRYENKRAREKDTVGGGDEMILKIQIPVLGDNNLFGFELVDTPGADEAGCSSIAGEINRVISDSSVILYLLNYTSFGKQADIDFINLVSKIQSNILEHCSQRMFFIINRIDQIGMNSAPLDSVITEVEATLSRLLPPSKDGRNWIPRDHILPVSALKGFISRSVTMNTMATESLEKLKPLLDPNDEREDIEDLRALCKSKRFVDKTNFFVAESKIFDHLRSNSGMIVLLSQQQALKNSCDHISNLLQTTALSLRDDLNSKKKQMELEQLSKQVLKEYNNKISRVPDTLRADIENWKQEKIRNMSKEIDFLIASSLNQNPVEMSWATQWIKAIRAVYRKLLWEGGATQDETKIFAENKDILQQAINDINNAIQEAVEVLMKKVIDDFEAESRFQIEALANLFSKMAETLSVKLTKSIGEVLEISLMHIKIDFKRLFEQNIVDLAAALQSENVTETKIVNREESTIIRVKEERHVAKKKFCGGFEMEKIIEEVPKTQISVIPTSVEHTKQVYVVEKEHMKQLWRLRAAHQCDSLSRLMAKTINTLISQVCEGSIKELQSITGEYQKLLRTGRKATKKDKVSTHASIERATLYSERVKDVSKAIDDFIRESASAIQSQSQSQSQPQPQQQQKEEVVSESKSFKLLQKSIHCLTSGGIETKQDRRNNYLVAMVESSFQAMETEEKENKKKEEEGKSDGKGTCGVPGAVDESVD